MSSSSSSSSTTVPTLGPGATAAATVTTPQQTKEILTLGAGAVALLLVETAVQFGAAAGVGAYMDKLQPKRGAIIGMSSMVGAGVASAVVRVVGGSLLRDAIRKSHVASILGARLRDKVDKYANSV